MRKPYALLNKYKGADQTLLFSICLLTSVNLIPSDRLPQIKMERYKNSPAFDLA